MGSCLFTFTTVGAATIISCLTPLVTMAQIVPDNSLGSENSVVTPNVNIRGIDSVRIDGGAIQDSSAIPRLVELQSPLIEPVTSQPNNLSQSTQQISQNRENNTVDSRTIVPARGWIRTEEGEVILVGYDPTNKGVIRQQSPINQCNPEPTE